MAVLTQAEEAAPVLPTLTVAALLSLPPTVALRVAVAPTALRGTILCPPLPPHALLVHPPRSAPSKRTVTMTTTMLTSHPAHPAKPVPTAQTNVRRFANKGSNLSKGAAMS